MKNKYSMGSVVKKMAPVLLASVFMLPLAARAEVKAGSVELTPFAGYNFFQKQQNLQDQPLVGGRIGYNFTEHVGIEGTWDFMRSYVDDKSPKPYRQGQFASPMNRVSITQFNLGLIYHFMPEGVFNPYIVAGYGINHYAPQINNKNMSVADLGVGAKYWVAEHVALRGDVRDNMIFDEHIHNIETSLGVVLAFGGETKTSAPLDSDNDGVLDPSDKCPNTPAGVAVDTDGCPLDSDKDGVPNYLDKCPDTPAGVTVNKDGCPLDSDQDGVTDHLDKCPNTPAGVAVDTDGCPLDSDRDGVADYLDKCPATPAGVSVGKDGCPLDSDGDGVPDYLDKCPGTPAGVTVDRYGCQLDSDKDGVPDYRDKCPGTPIGVRVNADGCPAVVAVPAQVKAAAAKRFCSKPAVLAINFASDKSDIKPEYHDELKTVGDFLSYFPNAKGEISGYTDSTASNAHNLKLSQRRAESVERYISKTFGINPGRIGTRGYGETKPVASNKTKAGRAKNRRIVANFTCE
ncbi:MAG: OmpA family protein [Geobacteraceae bacterium]|nr:OmpA family protein [Geobacteraceae bacterium]